jgi:uncharacterized peroxidase-related enzyme
MRLKQVQHGHRFVQKLKFAAAWIKGKPVSEVTRVLQYRPELFGAHFFGWVVDVMRGPSEWSVAERELFAAFVSRHNECEYCTVAHAAQASTGLPIDQVTAILDGDSEAVDKKLRVTLSFLKKLTLAPSEVGPNDVLPLRAAGVSDQAIEDAINICAIFNIMNRIAESLDFDQQTTKSLA